MKEYVLNYYPKFKCIAEKCQNTCCAGWEMCIDSESLEKYQTEKSDFSQALNKGINYKKSRFRADKKKRCAFLNEKGLCNIIINLGEQSLCQVCRDHPRFRSYFDDRTETGLGFCCEEVARIILSFDGKIESLLVSDDGEQVELDFNQKNVLNFRDKVLKILQDRSLSINDRIDKILKECNAKFSEQDFKKIIKTFLSFERVDKSWAKRLKAIDKVFNKTTAENLSHYCEQFLVNSVYRHLSDAEDTMWVRARTISTVFSWWIIKSIIAKEQVQNKDNFDLIVDIIRAYSTEVEYSQKNLDKLYSFAYKFIKI